MSAIYAARFPAKSIVSWPARRSDTSAGNDALRKAAMKIPMALFEELVNLGGGLMPGRFTLAAYKNMNSAQHYLGNRKPVRERTTADFEAALDKVRFGATHSQLVDPGDRRIVACHESGHTVVAWLTPGADPVQKVTVVPHCQALGLTEQLPTSPPSPRLTAF